MEEEEVGLGEFQAFTARMLRAGTEPTCPDFPPSYIKKGCIKCCKEDKCKKKSACRR